MNDDTKKIVELVKSTNLNVTGGNAYQRSKHSYFSIFVFEPNKTEDDIKTILDKADIKYLLISKEQFKPDATHCIIINVWNSGNYYIRTPVVFR